MDYIHHYSSPLGGLTLASDGEALVGLWFDGQKHFGSTLHPHHQEKALPVFEEADRWLDTYFSGEKPDFTPPLLLRGSVFRKTVWKALLTIPYGCTVTYGDIAKLISVQEGFPPTSARAVGSAVGHNPVSIIIPCHRVIGAGGRLTGYAAGIETKLHLLKTESADRDIKQS
ncbi:MAG: methylated-DNA--[protein]-cysteine S-methyltransferase [Clostridiales bacterium]|nr:methylated-DNA--[protein]-cysteine S-methyltransferase [Clostridiales bacterium]